MDRSASDEAAAEFEEVGAIEFLQRRTASSAQGRREAESHHGHVTCNLPAGHVAAVGRQVVSGLDVDDHLLPKRFDRLCVVFPHDGFECQGAFKNDRLGSIWN